VEFPEQDSTMMRNWFWVVPVGLFALLGAQTVEGGRWPVDSGLPGIPGSAVEGPQSKVAVAICKKVDGVLLERAQGGPFRSVRPGDAIAPESLLVGLPEGEVLAAGGEVLISLRLYMGEKLPVTEAAIVMHNSPGFNADLTIERGVVELQRVGGKEDAHVKVRAGSQVWEIALKEPGTSVLLVRFGRHEPGTKILRHGPKKELVDDPLMHLGMLVVKGQVALKTGAEYFRLNAPPGSAQVSWDTGSGYQVKHLDKLPDEIRKLDTSELMNYKAACEWTAKLAAGDLGRGLDALLSSDDALQRRVGVLCLGAVDDLPRMWEALDNAKHQDVRQQAILVLRNWLGSKPGQLTKLYDLLTKDKKLSPVEARTILQLLKGFDDVDRSEPVLYQLLIDALDQGALPVRELSHWHLERLVPAGQKIAYNAGADEAQRRQAVAEWHRLIPAGQMPPPPPKKDKDGK
jgi:hypothetical protein